MSPALLLTILTLAGADNDEIPLVGRPADLPFSGASAGFAPVAGDPGERVAPFRLTASATPTRLEAGTPLVFTVTITALGPVRRPPVRIDLRQDPAFKRRFHIEDNTDGRPPRSARATWQWSWRLKPRGPGVRTIPGMPFVFYNPDLRPVEKAFQVIYTDPIPVEVTPEEELAKPILWPATVLTLTTGPELTRPRVPWRLPGVGWLAVLLGGPPLVCLGWYLGWRWRYPDAAVLAQRRRSRAARQALRGLDRMRPSSARATGEQVRGIVVAYLRDRSALDILEPTPDETAEHLGQAGCSLELTDRVAEVLRRCDDVRFGPEATAPDLVGRARGAVLALEEHAWSA